MKKKLILWLFLILLMPAIAFAEIRIDGKKVETFKRITVEFIKGITSLNSISSIFLDMVSDAGHTTFDIKNTGTQNAILSVNSTEIVGEDSKVNKSVVEDSSNWDDAYTKRVDNWTAPLDLTSNTASIPAATNAVAGHATAAHIQAIEANTLKDTNVSTNLSAGARTATTIDVNSSDGSNATLVEANTTNAGILGSDKWDEIVANTVHAADNSQAHSDYLVNNANDTSTGILTALQGFITGNNDWIAGINYAGDGNINMLKVNVDDEIDVGGTLVSGSLEFTEDSGVATAMDMPVSATPADETDEGYYFKVDGDNICSVLADADSAGGVYGERLKVDSSLFLNDAQTFVDSDATPDVRGYSNFETNTSGVTITDFDWGGKTIPEGQLLIVVSKGAIVYDVTGQGIKGGTTDITTAAGDVTTFIYDGADWIITSFIDQSDDLN